MSGCGFFGRTISNLLPTALIQIVSALSSVATLQMIKKKTLAYY